jgi:hypothetical protein
MASPGGKNETPLAGNTRMKPRPYATDRSQTTVQESGRVTGHRRATGRGCRKALTMQSLIREQPCAGQPATGISH